MTRILLQVGNFAFLPVPYRMVYFCVNGFRKQISYTTDSGCMDCEHTFKFVIVSYDYVCTREINTRNKGMRIASTRGFGHYNCSHQF